MARREFDIEIVKRGHQLALDYLDEVADRPVRASATVEDLRRRLIVQLTDDPLPSEIVLDALASAGRVGTIASAGPRYFGFVLGGSFPIAVAADSLTTAWDQNAGIYATSPFSAVVEEATAQYVLDLLRLPSDSGVGFVTGCQMANFTALAAARHRVLRDAGWNVEERGLNGASRVNIVLSAEAHITIMFALRLLGFGTGDAIRVETDDQGRMSVSNLREVLSRCTGPTIVCTQAGDVNSGAFDPVGEICDAAHEKNAWVHVDGAFGLWARASTELSGLTAGLEKADSWATDAHKWMNVPYDCGIVIVRHADSHRASMSVKAAYLEQTGGEERDAIDWVPEFSRRARAVPLYAVLRQLGRRGVAELVDRCCAHARLFAQLLAATPGIEVINEVGLNQVLVRFNRDHEESDDLTREVIAAVQRDGTCWLAGTTWRGRAAMRISVSNWSTTEEDIRRSAEAIITAFKSVRRN